MKRKIGVALRMLGGFACLGAAGLSPAENIEHLPFGKVDQWIVSSPSLPTPEGKFYDQIRVVPGDRVLLSAGGCVLSGGRKKAWKRYVDPQGQTSGRLSYARIAIPGLAEMRIQDFLKQYREGFVTPSGTYAPGIWLGYKDDRRRDIVYPRHDVGSAEQCVGVENAWVSLTIIHP